MKFKITLLIILLLLIAVGYYLTTGHYSTGERAGTISKLSERGYIFKTYEGVLNEGGYSGQTGTLTPKYFEFSCKTDSTIAKLERGLKTGERVTLHYSEKFFQFPWNGDTKYFINDVEFLTPPPAAVQQVLPAPVPVAAPAKRDSTL
jgi:hypothetical protein